VNRILLFLLLSTCFLISNDAVTAEPDPFARWEKAIAAMEQKDRKSKPPQGAVLFAGSSSTRLWNLETSFPGIPSINRGFGGSKIADSTHFASRIILPQRPRIIILYAGDNDIQGGKKAEDVHRDFMKFVQTIHAELPETRIVFIAIKPSIKRWRLVDEMRKANAFIAAEARENPKLGYVDIDMPMIGKDGLPRKELFADDGLHLNEAGYRIWTDLVKPLLQ
jgi:lysophospholipase L1-like esterase